VFTDPGFSKNQIDQLNSMLGRFRYDAGDFEETRFQIE